MPFTILLRDYGNTIPYFQLKIMATPYVPYFQKVMATPYVPYFQKVMATSYVLYSQKVMTTPFPIPRDEVPDPRDFYTT